LISIKDLIDSLNNLAMRTFSLFLSYHVYPVLLISLVI